MWKEFKSFAMKGNVIDLAVGIIIGAAFGKIVSSFVTDILMPPLGLALGKVDFSSLFLNLSSTPYDSLAQAKLAGAPTINYGIFINNVIDFIIVAFAIFMMIRLINRFKEQDQPTVATKPCPRCVSNIPIAATKCAFCTVDLNSLV